MYRFFSLGLISLVFVFHAYAQEAKLSADDFKILDGTTWTGTLTYRDYGTNKPVSIKSKLNVTRSPADPSAWTFDYQYPDEPKANSTGDSLLSGDGRTFGGGTVIEKTATSDGGLRFVTEKRG